MGKIVPVKFGPRKTDVDVENRKYNELPGILAAIHDTEIPANIEIYADDKPVTDFGASIPEGIGIIELSAVAGQKQR